MSERAAVNAPVGGCLNRVGNGCTLMFVNIIMLVCLGIVGYFFYTSWNLQRNGVTTTGVVVSLEPHSDEDGETYSPVVSFTAQGKSYTFESSTSSDPPAYRVGEEVSLRYDPANPQRADIDSFVTSPWLYGIVLAVLGIATLVLNGVFLHRTIQGMM